MAIKIVRQLDPYGKLQAHEVEEREKACQAFEDAARAGEVAPGYYASEWPLAVGRHRALTAEEFVRFVDGADYLHAVEVWK